MRNQRGFTLIELIIVMVVLGIMAALAIPKFLDIRGDAQKAAVQGALGGVRSAIANYYGKQVSSTGTGSYPATALLIDTTTVMDGPIPNNPYDTTDPKNTVFATADSGATPRTVPCTGSLGQSWCYNLTNGRFWANTNVAGEQDF
jgi:MSHA pilin protein MshA